MIKFFVTVPCYNCQRWIVKCLDSIRSQNYRDFRAVIVDDGSTDNTHQRIVNWLDNANDSRFSLITNKANLGSPIGSICKAIDSTEMDGETVIVNVDGDDWLAANDVFSHLRTVYKTTDALMTYGQFEPASKTYSGLCAKVPNTKNYRKSKIWKKRMYATHLRTFKKKVFDQIDRADFMDFKDPSKYMQLAADMPLIFALLELCGNERSVFVRKVMYVYNDQNKLSTMYRNPEEQIRYAERISTRKVYREYDPD